MIAAIFTILFLIIIAPIVTSFMKSLKMILLYKQPASIFQGYRNIAKLMKKETIISHESSGITRIAPFLVLSPLLITLFFLPPIAQEVAHVDFVDAFTITGLVSLATFFLMLLGLDSASAFGGMGSSREAFVSALVEPAMVLTIFSISMIANDLSIAQASLNLSRTFPQEYMASFLFAAISFFILLVAENGRIPVDNPETHLELTMIHEAMILDLTGFYLMVVEVASSIKFIIFASLFSSLFLPFGAEWPFYLALPIFIVKLFLIASLVAFVEVNIAKLRLFRIPDLLGIAIVFAFLSLITFYILGT